ncbi:MAG: DnaD domain protein [Bacillota bacterium]
MDGSKWDKRFFFNGSADVTPVPNLLLKYYKQLGLSDTELVFLIQLLRLTKNGWPRIEDLAGQFEMDVASAQQNMASLIEKGIVVPENVIESGYKQVSRYYLDGLYDKLVDLWACQMASEAEIAATAPEKNSPDDKMEFSKVYSAFEQEFGRALSPMESEKIIEWLDNLRYLPEIVLEALKRSVLRGIYNFNYIDRILLEWQKANVRTLHEVHSYENKKMGREKPREKVHRKKSTPSSSNHKLKNLYEM